MSHDETGQRTSPDQYMLNSLQSTHQHADTKAGILATAQAALVGTAGAWSGHAVHATRNGGIQGALSAVLLLLFGSGLLAGAGALAAVLRPRILRPHGANRYSFAHLAGASSSAPPVTDTHGDGPGDDLSSTVRFLARVAMRKFRYLTFAVVCTATMGASAGLLMLARALPV
ncbi:MAG: DUF5706 domain-containing protein [Streptomyces sp.]|jgi:hypothetical protein|nr:DUF5706 domain-containing protein [Streptomyces sp.]